MSYKERAEAALAAGDVKNLVSDIITWETEGQVVVGRVKSKEPFTEGGFDAECFKYLIDTDDGEVSCVLGSAADKSLAKQDVVGRVLLIRYRGKKALQDGRRVNLFNVLDITETGKGKK